MNDTSPEAELVLIGVVRGLPPGTRWLQLGEMFRAARQLHAVGYLRNRPAATGHDILRHWLRVNLGCDIPPSAGETSMDNLPALREVLAVLDRLGIAYALGGSAAYGEYSIAGGGAFESMKPAEAKARPSH